jgi:hypothetical protein
MELKKALMNQFKCKDCGHMDEYVGWMIEKLKKREESSSDRKFCCKATEMNSTF